MVDPVCVVSVACLACVCEDTELAILASKSPLSMSFAKYVTISFAHKLQVNISLPPVLVEPVLARISQMCYLQALLSKMHR